ncbi:hypothetical protein TanjilG_11230 [Lupinus angustifolius]|uniref:4-hydroxy-tetrahydrodipicolinate reductase n=1 Tax=Lupinus angustifolius TaxID=3871 RepID=A0A1J7GP85_LUPAN|nr:hypothetical protein TanjilG_11230 [Lupinus angustifolius]
MAISLLKTPTSVLHRNHNQLAFVSREGRAMSFVPISQNNNRRSRSFPIVSMAATPVQTFLEKSVPSSQNTGHPIMVNACTGKMGKAVIEAAQAAGLHVVPVSFGLEEESGKTFQIGEIEFLVHGPSDRESVLASVLDKYPDLIVVDYTAPTAVNGNAELYCKLGVPFVMGTTGGDRELLRKTVEDAKVVAFLAAMEIMAEQFPGAFSGYSLQVLESHQAGKADASGTAKAVISCFEKLGVSFNMDEIQLIRDPKQQLEMVGVPEEHLAGHAFHMYHLTSPDETVSFEFQHNVCGRSIYAEGTVDAALFLAKKIESKDQKRIYNMIDVLREGNMR